MLVLSHFIWPAGHVLSAGGHKIIDTGSVAVLWLQVHDSYLATQGHIWSHFKCSYWGRRDGDSCRRTTVSFKPLFQFCYFNMCTANISSSPIIKSSVNESIPWLGRSLLTAVDFIRGGVVSAVTVAITDKGCTDTASVGAGELSRGVTGGEGAAPFITVVTAVICVVTGVADWHAAPVVTGEVHSWAGVEGCVRRMTDSRFIF